MPAKSDLTATNSCANLSLCLVLASSFCLSSGSQKYLPRGFSQVSNAFLRGSYRDLSLLPIASIILHSLVYTSLSLMMRWHLPQNLRKRVPEISVSRRFSFIRDRSGRDITRIQEGTRSHSEETVPRTFAESQSS